MKEEEISELAWLATAMYLSGKKCVKCGYEWHSREDTLKNEPIGWDDGEVICTKCWSKC